MTRDKGMLAAVGLLMLGGCGLDRSVGDVWDDKGNCWRVYSENIYTSAEMVPADRCMAIKPAGRAGRDAAANGGAHD